MLNFKIPKNTIPDIFLKKSFRITYSILFLAPLRIMKYYIIEILLIGVAVSVAAYFIPGVEVSGFGTAVLAGILIALANATIGSVLRLLTFPINFMTLGLVSFLITVLMVLLVDHYLPNFNISGFIATVKFAIALAILKAILGLFNRK